MSDWGYAHGAQILESAGHDTATSSGVAPSTPGGTHTKGAWTQLIASTSRRGVGILLNVSGDNATMTGLLDIGIGAALSEVVLVPDYHFQRLGSSYGGAGQVFIPCNVPAGSRLSCRYQGSATTAAIRVAVQVVSAPAGMPVFGRKVKTYGANAGTSKGVSVAASSTTHTKGAWVDIVASTPMASQWAVLSVLNDSTSGKYNLIDIAIGSGPEQIIIPNLFLPGTQTAQLTACGKVSLPLHIPAGVRVAARAQSDVSSANFSVSLTVSG